MNIDWKVVSQSDGYKSLKAAYERDVQDAHKELQRGRRPMRDKQEFRKLFDWVISRAIHYAYHKQTTVDVILNQWEADRDYWWLNYYQESRQPWLVKSEHVRHRTVRNYYKKDSWYKKDSKKVTKYYFIELVRLQKEQSKRKGKKARWSSAVKARKALEKKFKDHLKTKSIR